VIFALGGGILSALIRLFGSYPEGCSYAILIMNAVVPLIDRTLPPRRFGTRGLRPPKEASA
jgi:electron transport complex protein RnfD